MPFWGGGGYAIPVVQTLDAATVAWVNAVIANGGTVSLARKSVVDTLIVGLKADGLFTKLDRLWLFAGENEPSALTDIIADQLATAVNSPGFVADSGYTGNGSNMQVSSNFNPTTAPSPNFTQDSGCFVVWANGTALDGGAAGGDDLQHTILIVSSTFGAGFSFYGINDPGGGFNCKVANTDFTGLFHADRDGAASQKGYKNGAVAITDTAASTTLVNGTLAFLHAGSSWSVQQQSAGGFGASLNATDAANLYTRLRTYMTSVGVP